MKAIENLCDEVETVNEFCYLGDKLKLVENVRLQLQQE